MQILIDFLTQYLRIHELFSQCIPDWIYTYRNSYWLLMQVLHLIIDVAPQKFYTVCLESPQAFIFFANIITRRFAFKTAVMQARLNTFLAQIIAPKPETQRYACSLESSAHRSLTWVSCHYLEVCQRLWCLVQLKSRFWVTW